MQRALGSAVNGVVHSVDVNDLVQRIDWDEVLDQIDMDRLLDRVDWNRLVDRIDVERLVERIPIDEVIERSNLSPIIARSTSGVFTHVLDALRAQGIIADQYVQSFGRLRCCKQKLEVAAWSFLPPMPKKVLEGDEQQTRVKPQSVSELAFAVQGRNAGICSRTLAYLIDNLAVFITLSIVATLFGILFEQSDFKVQRPWILALAYIFFEVSYHTILLVVVGRTFGKMIAGLLVVKYDRSGIAAWQALLRSSITTFLVLVVFSSFLGLVRKDRRAFHDIISKTTVIYAWDARNFRLREEAMSEAERKRQPYAHTHFFENIRAYSLPPRSDGL